MLVGGTQYQIVRVYYETEKTRVHYGTERMKDGTKSVGMHCVRKGGVLTSVCVKCTYVLYP